MQANQKHPCQIIYEIGGKNKIYGVEPGICRITGIQTTGLPFDKWVKNTFTDHAFLKPGSIISNEALFCFEEKSTLIQALKNKEKPQRFRTYSHVVHRDKWHVCTKADKRLIYDLITDGASLVCLSDSGQKHLLFKHRPGMWQLEDSFIIPDIEYFKWLHEQMCTLLDAGFSQTEVITGHYLQYRIMQATVSVWKTLEDKIKPCRGTSLFNLAAWLLFTNQS